MSERDYRFKKLELTESAAKICAFCFTAAIVMLYMALRIKGDNISTAVLITLLSFADLFVLLLIACGISLYRQLQILRKM